MRMRYSRMMHGRDVALVDGPVFLVGLYCAISPWTVHFSGSQPDLTTHHLIVGIAIGLLALGFTMAPARMYGLSWAMCAMGAWLVVSSWVVGDSPDAGIIWNNIIVGGVTFLLGALCAAAAARTGRET